MADQKEYLSKEKFQELTEELEYLKKTKRREVADSLEYAKSMGDLSENAEYHEAREVQAEVEDRIGKLEQILSTAVIVKDNHSAVVGMGSTVVVQKSGSKENKTYKIVGTEEANITENKISHQSPLGLSLIGKKKGDSFDFSTPSGKVSYKIIDVK